MSANSQNTINALGFASINKELEANFRQVEEIMKEFTSSYDDLKLDPFNLSQLYMDWFNAISKNPERLVQANVDYWTKSLELTQRALTGYNNQDTDSPVISEEKGDRRFRHDSWENDPAFSVIKQSYLLVSQWVRTITSNVDGLDKQTAERVQFFTERMLDSLSPTNFAMTNPAVLEKIRETKGANLVHGLKNMLGDLEEGKGMLRIRMTDNTAFELGENIAATPGKVVYQNRMFQLLQYTPATASVLKRPLLIVPPWINKFYILDLQEKNSLLKWLVEQGHTVYVISWVNPDESYAETQFEDYMLEGVLKAVDAVEHDSGENEINAIGYCIGGTLLSSTLAYMKAKGDQRIKSTTFFTTMTDFEEPGELGVFIDEHQIGALEDSMEKKGYLDGSLMSGAFNMLRANDLIWSFYINNYLMGNDPRPFDLLYWNSDSTRMPAKMHAWYLRNLYLNNQLCQPGALTLAGESIDLSQVDIPVCYISTIDDHIAPWKSTYAGAKLFSGDTKFILGGSGHIAGIVNPPAANKYGYRTTDLQPLPDNPDAWLSIAEEHPGSWWPAWHEWIQQLDNAEVEARVPGKGGLAAIEDAPGSYVKCKLGEPTPKLEETQLTKPKARNRAGKTDSQ